MLMTFKIFMLIKYNYYNRKKIKNVNEIIQSHFITIYLAREIGMISLR